MSLGDVLTPVQALENFAEGFIGWKPLFSNAVQIGNWTSAGGFFDVNAQDVMGNLCRGIVQFNPGVTDAQRDPNTWTTVDDLWLPISVNNYCMQKHVPPSWFTQDQASGYVQTASGSYVPQQNSVWVPLAIAGGLVGLSLLLIARR